MKNSTRIVIILDRSGSMESARESTINGLNKFIREQKTAPGEATLKLVQFDDNVGFKYDVVLDQNITEVRELTQSDFVPRGLTPLLDAQGRTINDLGKELSSLSESDRPNKVLVVTITDGYENASHEFTASKIKEMIEHQTKVYNWDFVYLGANQDAVAVGSTYGYIGTKAMNFNVNNAQAVGSTFSNLSSYTRRTRSAISGQSIQENSFSDEERSTSVTGE